MVARPAAAAWCRRRGGSETTVPTTPKCVCRSPWRATSLPGRSAKSATCSEALIPALLLAFEACVLIILGFDLTRGFAPLSPLLRVLILAWAALAPLVALWPRERRRHPARIPLLMIAGGSIALAWIGLLESRASVRIQETWEAGAHDRLETQARALEQDFARFLAGLSRPILRSVVPVGDRRAAFDRLSKIPPGEGLSRDRLGYSIYEPDGSLLAWFGNSSDAPRDLLVRPCQ